jgi:hypothetical protein
VTVHPDSRLVYAAAVRSDILAVFSHDPATGATAFDGCIASGVVGCRNPGSMPPLDGVNHPEPSADGRDLYIASAFANSISHFRRDASPAALPPPGPGAAVGNAPAEVAAPRRARIRRRALVLRRDGNVSVVVECPSGPGACEGAVSLRRAGRKANGAASRQPVLLGSRRFSVAAGRRAAVRVRLRPAARRLVRVKRRLRVRVTARTRVGVATTATVSRVVSLRSR